MCFTQLCFCYIIDRNIFIVLGICICRKISMGIVWGDIHCWSESYEEELSGKVLSAVESCQVGIFREEVVRMGAASIGVILMRGKNIHLSVQLGYVHTNQSFIGPLVFLHVFVHEIIFWLYKKNSRYSMHAFVHKIVI